MPIWDGADVISRLYSNLVCFSRRKRCVFYQNDGGYQSTSNQETPLEEIYFLGIIDILTPYNLKKEIEHFFKSLSYDEVSV